MKNTSAWAAAYAPAGTRWGKKALSLLLSLVLCLSLLPGIALATDAEAEVNGKQYTSLAEAIQKAEDGSTVTLLKDAETTEKITIEKKSLTIDLSGKAWKRTGTLLKIDSDANVIVKGGTMDFTVEVGSGSTVPRETDAIVLPSGAGSLTLEDVSIKVTNGSSNGGSSIVHGYAVRVFGGSLAIRGDGEYGRLYVNFDGSPAVKLYGGTYTEIDLNGGDGSNLLDKGYIFVDADKDNEYVNVTGKPTIENLKVIACTHENGADFSSGYCSRCSAECPHQYNGENGNNNCPLCNKSLAAQVTDVDETSWKYYIDLKDAFDEAAEGNTVKLLKEASESFTVSTSIKLDCNGHTFNGTLTVSNGVTLASLLPEGYAFQNRYTKTWISDSDLSGKTSLDYFTTAEAPITSVTPVNPTNSIRLGESVTLTANLIYPPEGSDQFQLTWYCNNTEAGKRTIGVSDISELGNYSLDQTPTTAGTHTYRLVFTRDGYSKSCTFTVTVAKTYTVTFDANGGSAVDPQSIASGDKVTKPSDPTRDGYFFTGWYLGDTDQKWNFETDTVTEDITLTAKWAERKYTVTASGLYGGTMGINPGETYTAKYAEGEPVGLQIGKRDGYTLESLTLEGITEDDLIWHAKGNEVETRGISFTMPEHDVSVTVNWKKNSSSSGGGSVSTYAVSVGKTEHGSVTVSPKSAAQGTTVTVTVAPDKGYALETLTVTDKDGKALTLTRKSDTQYSFSMPASDVTVQAAFLEDNTVLNYFVDVKAGSYCYDAVLWAAEQGITLGTDAEHFSPSAPCTRAQIVTFLWRAAGSPAPKATAMPFTDVRTDSVYAKAILWAVEQGITLGTTETTFSPDAPCTQAQAVMFLFRYAAPEAVTLQELVSGYADAASVPGYALPAMNWALAAGILRGDGQKLIPGDTCTRGQIVTFLHRALAK